MKFLFLLLATFGIFNSPLAAETVRQIVATDVSKKETKIMLSDGTLWSYKDGDLFVPLDGWQIGDRVDIVYTYFYGYHLQNKSYQGTAPVTLENAASSEIQSLKITSLFKDANDSNSTTTLVLEDGSLWYVGSWSSSWMDNWALGDRMLVMPHEFMLGNAKHLLINLDRPLSEENAVRGCIRAQHLNGVKEREIPDLQKRAAKDWSFYVSDFWNEKEGLVVLLNNGMRWQCFSFPNTVWKKGQGVDLRCGPIEFELENQETKETLKGSLVSKGSNESQKIFIKKIHTSSKKILLSDGTVWLFHHSLPKWKEGDGILVAYQGPSILDFSEHQLINIGKPDLGPVNIKGGTSATLIR